MIKKIGVILLVVILCAVQPELIPVAAAGLLAAAVAFISEKVLK